MSSRRNGIHKQAGLQPSNTTTINWTGPDLVLSQPLSPKNHRPAFNHNSINKAGPSRHVYSHTQPLKDILNSNKFFNDSNNNKNSKVINHPPSPQYIPQRSGTITSQISLNSTSSAPPYNNHMKTTNRNNNNSNNKQKPLPSRPLTPNHKHTSSQYMFKKNNGPHPPPSQSMRHLQKRKPPLPPSSPPGRVSVTTRPRHQGSIATNTLDQSWHAKYLKLEEKYNKLLAEKNDLQKQHGGLKRSYKELQTKFQLKSAECKDLLEEKEELNRSLKEVRRRDSIAKSQKSDNDNISLSGDFSDNKSEYSMVGGLQTMKHQLIASPSQSVLSSVPPYNASHHGGSDTNSIYHKAKSSNRGSSYKQQQQLKNGILIGPPQGANSVVFSDDGNESDNLSVQSGSTAPPPHKSYSKIGGYNRTYHAAPANNVRATNGSYSSMDESDNNSQRLSYTRNNNNKNINGGSYKSEDQFDEHSNMDPYANSALL